MKKITLSIIFMLVLTTLFTLNVTSQDGTHYTTPLIAGQTNIIGEVEYWHEADQFHVHFNITESGWALIETHVHIADTIDDFPMTKKGSPKIGKFDYKETHNYATEYTYHISWPSPDDNEYIAAHAVVTQQGGATGILSMLPATASMQIPYPPTGGGLAYFPQVIVTNGGMLDGTYLGWCIDTDTGIQIGSNIYPVNVYSSYGTFPAGLVEFPENFDLVNWILNQNYVGQTSTCGGIYTYGDVQRAIWELLDDNPDSSGLGDWSQCRVDEITAAAYANGEGFVPGCGDKISIILDPGNRQPVIIQIDIPCYGDETAWGNGISFPGDSWAMYIHWESS